MIQSSTLGEISSKPRRKPFSRSSEIVSDAAAALALCESMVIPSVLDAVASPSDVAVIEMVDRIAIAASRAWKVPLGTVFSKSHSQEVCGPRWTVTILAMRAGYTPKQIGTALNQDRTTVYNSLRRATERLEKHALFRELTARVMMECGL